MASYYSENNFNFLIDQLRYFWVCIIVTIKRFNFRFEKKISLGFNSKRIVNPQIDSYFLRITNVFIKATDSHFNNVIFGISKNLVSIKNSYI